MGALGGLLVASDQPASAGMVVVLAGDDTGRRILKAAELVKQGYAPQVLVSGPECCYGENESDLAIAFAVRHGYPAEWFIPLPLVAHSTREEAQIILRELKRRNVRKFLLVTSDFHTARAARVYRRLNDPVSFRMIATPDCDFSAHGWWHTREGRKTFLYEWVKTVADWVGM
jgi:uncharacterized SAM-binding protein YcdF (DUF218 family)